MGDAVADDCSQPAVDAAAHAPFVDLDTVGVYPGRMQHLEQLAAPAAEVENRARSTGETGSQRCHPFEELATLAAETGFERFCWVPRPEAPILLGRLKTFYSREHVSNVEDRPFELGDTVRKEARQVSGRTRVELGQHRGQLVIRIGIERPSGPHRSLDEGRCLSGEVGRELTSCAATLGADPQYLLDLGGAQIGQRARRVAAIGGPRIVLLVGAHGT